MALLDVRDLAVSVAGIPLLRGLSCALLPGELVGLLGPSGSGKTTLLRTIAALQDPAAGQVRLRDRGPAEWGYPRWRRQVAYVAQRAVLLAASVRDNLARPFAYATSGGAFPEDEAERLLERLRLPAGRLEQDAGTLSEGEKQRVALVRALLVRPEVLLLDEPTAALDPAAVEAAEALVREQIAERGAAGLIVTHDPAQAARWCDRVLDIGPYVETRP